MSSSSRTQDIISTDFKIAQTLKNQPREAPYPHRREEPRPDMRGLHPVHYEARTVPRGDPRDQIPSRGDPREMFRDPRMAVDPRTDPRPDPRADPRLDLRPDPRADPRAMIDRRPSYID